MSVKLKQGNAVPRRQQPADVEASTVWSPQCHSANPRGHTHMGTGLRRTCAHLNTYAPQTGGEGSRGSANHRTSWSVWLSENRWPQLRLCVCVIPEHGSAATTTHLPPFSHPTFVRVILYELLLFGMIVVCATHQTCQALQSCQLHRVHRGYRDLVPPVALSVLALRQDL